MGVRRVMLIFSGTDADAVARIGGDELAVILAPLRDPGGARLRYGRSIGAAVCLYDTDSLTELIELADRRMDEDNRYCKALAAGP